MEKRYQLIRWAYKMPDGWQRLGEEFYDTKVEVMAAYNRAKLSDGAWPDVVDTKTEEYIA